jgi:hypothetical protein
MPVIAQLPGQLMQRVKAIASQTLSAGRALLGHILQSGSRFSVPDTLQQPQPAPTQQSLNSGRVLQTIQGQKHGSVNLTVRALTVPLSIQAGSKSQTLAPQTHQPVKQEQSQLKKVAKRTTLDQSQKQDKARAQTRMERQSGESGKPKAPVSKTRQPAKPVAKASKKPAQRGTRVKSPK